MKSSKTSFVSSKTLRIDSIKRKIQTFIYLKRQWLISTIKKAIGITLDNINYPVWKTKLKALVIDHTATALVIAFILMAFTKEQTMIQLIVKGLAITLVLTLLLSFTKRFKEAIE